MSKESIYGSMNRQRQWATVVGMLVVMLICPSAHASFSDKLNITKLEFQSLSKDCQVIIANNLSDQSTFGRGWSLGKDQGMIAWNAGMWHYCGGVIRIRRGELSFNQAEREDYLRKGIDNAMYSYQRIDKTNPWSAEIATTIARAYRDLSEKNNAKKFLDEALKYHPDYAAAYALYAMIYFDQGEYKTAKDYLLKADRASKGQSSEVIYFLGLASFKLGQIDEAHKYAKQAADMGYPLTGLQDKLKALENVGKKQ